MKKDIFEDSNSSGEDEKLVVNKAYAQQYEKVKKKQELERLSMLRESDFSGSESSESETEDEDGEMLTTALDYQIHRAINRIRSKDPAIYDPQSKFYANDEDEEEEEDEDEQEATKSRSDRVKPMKYKDVAREQLLSSGAGADIEAAPNKRSASSGELKSHQLAYDEEQRDLRQRLLDSLGKASGDEGKATAESSDIDEELLVVRKKTAQEIEANERQLQDEISQMKSSADTNEDEKFLVDFISNRRWKDQVPGIAFPRSTVDDAVENGVISDAEDESEIDKQDHFEAKYNFRFQEDGSSNIRSYARNVQGSMRREDDKRKKDREVRKQRKLEERKRKEEELRRLKNLKREEIKRKLEAIREMSGGAEVGEDILEEDFDPENWDQKMANAFDDDYYENAREDHEVDGVIRGGSEYISDIDDNDKAQHHGGDVDEDQEEVDDSVSSRLRDELYKFDYEDLIGDLPVRFKYKKVERDSFGLDAEEILFARDEDLNKFVSLKKLAPYREQPFKVDARRRRRLRDAIKQHQEELKSQNKTSNVDEPESKPQRKRRKRRRAGEATASLVDKDELSITKNLDRRSNETTQERRKSRKKAKKKGQKHAEIQGDKKSASAAAKSRLASYGING